MTYLNAKKYIDSLPDTSPEPRAGARLGRILEALGNPQKGLKYISLTGSNGKTVCAEMLLSVYRDLPYSVGAFLSKNRRDPRRSLRINGAPLSMEDTAALVAEIRQAVTELNRAELARDPEAPTVVPTVSELFLVLALLAFRGADCRLCFIENDPRMDDPIRFLPPPMGAVICGAIPHKDRKEMQGIRAGIRHGIREIVSAPQNLEAHTLIANTCAAFQCRLTIPARSEIAVGRMTLRSTEFTYQGRPYCLGLCGKFQITNATVVIETLSMLERMGYPVSEEQKKKGLSEVRIPGKFEVLSSSPTIIADSTHALVAIDTVLASLADFRSMLGTSVRLLLPDGILAAAYTERLCDMGYRVTRLVLLSDRNEVSDDSLTHRHTKKKDAIRKALDSQAPDEILLISGPADFTEEIRYDLLQMLGF